MPVLLATAVAMSALTGLLCLTTVQLEDQPGDPGGGHRSPTLYHAMTWNDTSCECPASFVDETLTRVPLPIACRSAMLSSTVWGDLSHPGYPE